MLVGKYRESIEAFLENRIDETKRAINTQQIKIDKRILFVFQILFFRF